MNHIEAIQQHVGEENVDGLEEIAFLLGVQPDDLYDNDEEHFNALQPQTRRAIVHIAAMKTEREVDLGLMVDVARHVAPDTYAAVMAAFGYYPTDDKHVWTDEERRALHLRASGHLATMT